MPIHNDPYEYPEEDNEAFEQQFSDYNSLYELYRAIYKYTDCGPSMGAAIFTEWPPEPNLDESGPGGSNCFGKEETRWYYCDDLRQLGTFKDMRENGLLIQELSVGSIVEGVNYDCETIHVEWNPLDREPEEIKDEFWQAVKDVDDQADRIWKRTHGCSGCFDLWQNETDDILGGGWIPVDGDPMYEDCYEGRVTFDDVAGRMHVHEDCKICGGHGVPF